MRLNTTQRNNWAQLRISACALLLPPLTLGAALYSMLAPPDEGTARPGAAAGAQAVRPELPRDSMQARGVSPDPQYIAQPTRPIAVADQPAPPDSRNSVSATGARHPVDRSLEDVARVSVPVRIATEPSVMLNAPPPANLDRAPMGSPGAELSAPAEVSTALLPRALNPSGQAPPQMQSPRMLPTEALAAQAPLAADLPSAEGPPTSSAGKPARPSHPVNRSEAPAARRNAQPQRQQAFSLKNWIEKLGLAQRQQNRGGRDKPGHDPREMAGGSI